MKRFTAIISLVLICTLLFCGCTSNKPGTSPKVSPNSSPAITSPSPDTTSPDASDMMPDAEDGIIEDDNTAETDRDNAAHSPETSPEASPAA